MSIAIRRIAVRTRRTVTGGHRPPPGPASARTAWAIRTLPSPALPRACLALSELNSQGHGPFVTVHSEEANVPG